MGLVPVPLVVSAKKLLRATTFEGMGLSRLLRYLGFDCTFSDCHGSRPLLHLVDLDRVRRPPHV